jgi:flagellar protein FlbT
MALVISIKPQERIILGGAVVRNHGTHSVKLLIETPAPILRCPDIIPESDANTPCARIYMAIELLYIQPEQREECMRLYLALTGELRAAVPSMAPFLEEIHPLVAEGHYYKALQKMKHLLRREKGLLALAAAAS